MSTTESIGEEVLAVDLHCQGGLSGAAVDVIWGDLEDEGTGDHAGRKRGGVCVIGISKVCEHQAAVLRQLQRQHSISRHLHRSRQCKLQSCLGSLFII